MKIPDDLKYTREHEWARMEGEEAVFGITDHAQDALGDIVFVELPQPGRRLKAGEAFAVVESVKAVSDVFAPLGGEVIEVNKELESAPEKINEDPYGEGWLIRVRVDASDSVELMDSKGYAAYLDASAS